MGRKHLLLAVSALLAGAAVFFGASGWRGPQRRARRSFVQRNGARFEIDGRPFRFAGANLDLIFSEDTRGYSEDLMRFAADKGIKVVRVWISGEGGPDDVQPVSSTKWKRNRWFRRTPAEWNEEEFVALDRVLDQAAHHGLRVQLCLANWWRDTGGVTQYLRWAGVSGADDDKYPFGINNEKAMLFYTNETARRLYREQLAKVATRRNTINGTLYRDDPTIFGYELMNEAQCVTGRWPERRAWLAEMSTYLKSLDPDHLIAAGDWGYRSAAERREWLLDHNLPNIDYCDVHSYPREDGDSFVDSPRALGEFIDNRAAAAFSIQKPIVFGEFGISSDGYSGRSRAEWFRSYYESTARAGVGGAMFWILTPDPQRNYGVTHDTPRDDAVLAEISGGAHLFTSLANASPPPGLLDFGKHLVPHQFRFSRADTDPGVQPQLTYRDDGTVLYRFGPNSASIGQFEKLGGADGYVWGGGVGYFEFRVPARPERRRVGQIIVRAHLQPVLPVDVSPSWIRTRVTLFINGVEYESRLIPVDDPRTPLIQEWRVDSWSPRLRAARGLAWSMRFVVTPLSDWPYGVNISNWSADYNSHDAAPVEIELR